MNAWRVLALAAILSCFFGTAGAAGAAGLTLEQAPDRSADPAALQRGARTFIQYCLSCHPASLMRYNRLLDIGFTAQQVRDELLFTGKRIGDPMFVSMDREDAKRWFGMTPPDHSLTARARTTSAGSGSDWLYTYMKTFYRDPARPSSWNNLVFPNVGMHHVLWEFQGEQTLQPDGRLSLASPGQLTAPEYDDFVADLVGFMQFMSDPTVQKRRHVGAYVVGFMCLLLILFIAIKPESSPRRRKAN